MVGVDHRRCIDYRPWYSVPAPACWRQSGQVRQVSTGNRNQNVTNDLNIFGKQRYSASLATRQCPTFPLSTSCKGCYCCCVLLLCAVHVFKYWHIHYCIKQPNDFKSHLQFLALLFVFRELQMNFISQLLWMYAHINTALVIKLATLRV